MQWLLLFILHAPGEKKIITWPVCLKTENAYFPLSLESKEGAVKSY